MPAQFQFMMQKGPTPGQEFPLEGAEIIMGRDNSCSLVIPDAEVSRKHCRLIWQGSAYVLEDTGSTNGTFVNGKRLSDPHILLLGDLVSLGENITLLFEPVIDLDATVMSTPATFTTPELQDQVPVPEPFFPKNEAPAPEPILPKNEAPVPTPEPVNLVQDDLPIQSKPNRKRRKVISTLIIVLVVICLCVAIAYFVYDFLANAPISFWCNTFSFYFKPELYPQCMP